VEGVAGPSFSSVEEVLTVVSPAVRVDGPVRVLPRVGQERAVVHVLNLACEPARDAVRPLYDLELRVDVDALGVPGSSSARVLSAVAAPIRLVVRDGRLVFPDVGLWTLVVLEGR
jgi:hypothetical protein